LADIRPRAPYISSSASFIAEWTGVPLSHALNLVGISPQAKFVVVFPYDDAWDSLDPPDAFHPQTFLTYGLNGSDLSTDHGAPLRLRVARQLGYKSVKYLSRITVTDSLKNRVERSGLGTARLRLFLVRRNLRHIPIFPQPLRPAVILCSNLLILLCALRALCGEISLTTFK
jgi:Oxidoreductase molybdopterin binding domain